MYAVASPTGPEGPMVACAVGPGIGRAIDAVAGGAASGGSDSSSIWASAAIVG